ncbi:Do family serine endopeptidase [Prosthecobacter dejongeii]|uniref:Serine protease Do n=1 Tax=Prosthecobacter dejongeii TaxID=48465 RepID=A0A7W8DQ34_9BACT|nr:Do family serine endopeptidase [Prosthecobacter dejongeii]MBB5038043.1 serine protease Do [Prosthecobacter dejongeii]
MKTPIRLTQILAAAGLLTLSISPLVADLKAPPKLAASEFHARLLKDDAALPAGGQLQMSYATVVEKILPSVVTIFAYGGKSDSETPKLEDIPPQLRPFFDRFFDENGNPESPQQQPRNPRGRRGGQQQEEEERSRPNGVGSGFIVSSDGYIMTNNHVVGEAEKIEAVVEINGLSRTYLAKVIGTDPLTDVALIKIDATDLPQATLGDSDKLRVGDIVLAAGAPMELNRSVTQGIVSALGRSGMNIVGNGRMAGYEDFIQTDASINPGNSGGPLVDALGRVVGINTAILSRSGMNAGIGFAIPVNMAMRIVEDLIDNGSVRRGRLGIVLMDLDREKAEILGLKDQGGAVVRTVFNDTPAEKAGMEPGDVVTHVDGQRVDSSAKLRLVISGRKPGTAVNLTVLRDGKSVPVTATLDEMTDDAVAQSNTNSPRGGGTGTSIAEIIPGVTVQNLTPATRERYDIPANVVGVIVTKLEAESKAAAMGMEEGDVIMTVNKNPVRAVGEAHEMAKTSEKTVMLKVYRGGDTMLFMVNKN